MTILIGIDDRCYYLFVVVGCCWCPRFEIRELLLLRTLTQMFHSIKIKVSKSTTLFEYMVCCRVSRKPGPSKYPSVVYHHSGIELRYSVGPSQQDLNKMHLHYKGVHTESGINNNTFPLFTNIDSKIKK